MSRAPRLRLRALATALALTGPGCVDLTVGRSFDPAAARSLEPLRTTRAEVDALLGPPLRVDRVGGLRLAVHKLVTPDVVRLVIVSYRDGEEVVHVTVGE